MIVCKVCHKAAPELQPMEEFTSLKHLKECWLCHGCRNTYDTFQAAPKPQKNIHCKICGKVIKIVRKYGVKDICWLCRERGVTTSKQKDLNSSVV